MTRPDLAEILPDGTGLGLRPLSAPQPPLWPGEAEAMARALPVRQVEFAAGRAAARTAMMALGMPAAAVRMGPDRGPVWPPDLCGSITHGGDWAAAVVARRTRWASLGLDIEPARPMQADLVSMIVTQADHNDGGLPSALAATLFFCIKEAVFKAQFPLTGLWLEFCDVAVTLTPGAFVAAVGPVALRGRWCACGGDFASALAVTPEQAGQLARLGPDVMAL